MSDHKRTDSQPERHRRISSNAATQALQRQMPRTEKTIAEENSEDQDEEETFEEKDKNGLPKEKTEEELTNEEMRWWMESSEKKRLFICCDGTWQNASGTTSPLTNVAKLARAVDRLGRDFYQAADPDHEKTVRNAAKSDDLNGLPLEPERVGLVRQIVYYSSGIGGQTALHLERGYSGLTGKGLESNILNAYCFICNNYNFSSSKDEIILVGFSRGAFTVRCLANFIDKVGLLRRKGLPFLRPLFDSCKKWGRAEGRKKIELDLELKLKMEALNCLRVPDTKIRILAEWDPVSAIGLPLGLWREKFSFVNNIVPKCVQHAFFALALDEKRRGFKPRPWMTSANPSTFVSQCAFVGCHSDIGGGNPDVGLSTVSLIWMVSMIKAHSKAAFDEGALLQFMFPFQPRRFDLGRKKMSWKSPGMEVKNFAGTKGPVHESFRGGWRIPWALSFGLWHGKRDSIFHEGRDPFKLEIHFTAALLRRKSHCRLYKKHIYIDESERWLKKNDTGAVLNEATPWDYECELLQKWISLAERFDRSAMEGRHLIDDGNDVDWTMAAQNLQWNKPGGRIEEDALVTLIARDIHRQRARSERANALVTTAFSSGRGEDALKTLASVTLSSGDIFETAEAAATTVVTSGEAEDESTVEKKHQQVARVDGVEDLVISASSGAKAEDNALATLLARDTIKRANDLVEIASTGAKVCHCCSEAQE